MASYVNIDPHGTFVFEDDGGKISMIVRDDDGYQIKVKLTSDYMALFAYHSTLFHYEMTGELPMLPNVGAEAPQGSSVVATAGPAQAPAPRTRTRPSVPTEMAVAQFPQDHTTPGPRIRRRV